MNSGAAVNYLRGLMDKSTAPKDDRWHMRVSEIPAAVDSAVAKYGKQTTTRSSSEPQPEPEPKPEPKPEAELKPKPKPKSSTATIEDTVKVFESWLVLSSSTPVYAMLGTVAANLLEGDPVWLGLIAPGSSAKTELLNSVSRLSHMHPVGTMTLPALLSGTPTPQRAKNARGGLLCEIGPFGIIVLKDFGSVLSMRPDAKAEVIGALREVYDGEYTRRIGTEGGRRLYWKGKAGLIFGSTAVIDSHHSVIGAMGERFLLSRLKPEEGQFKHALKHTGKQTAHMRQELAESVTKLFAQKRREPQPISDDEAEQLDKVISLVVRLRGPLERDRHSREIENIYGAEGTGRLGLTLERLLAGLDSLGVDRTVAFKVVKSVAMDSVPPIRRAAYEYLRKHGAQKTPDIATALGLPTNTVRRALEDLAAYQLVERKKGGKADMWTIFGAGFPEEEEADNPTPQTPASLKFKPAKVGRAPAGVDCVHCGIADDRPVFKIRDGRVPRGQPGSGAQCLHEDCAEAWFTGKPP
jgi:hypothetical protein